MAATANESWWSGKHRLAGLRRFAVAITVLNVLGYTVLGFEQSIAVPLVALAVAYSMELALEWLDARANNRKPFYSGGWLAFTDFLLSAHITGLAVSMLLYAGDRLFPVAFASAVAIGSKRIFRVPAGKGTRHFFNPSNFGITVTLLAFSWVGIAPPYMFTENISGIFDWILPGIIVVSGTFINYKFTHKLPLVIAWLSAFIAQGLLRGIVFDTPIGAPLVMMTSLPFVLYTFYMVTDPATTPMNVRAQIAFGAGVAAVYGLLASIHVVFGLFFALTIVCTVRGLSIYVAYAWNKGRERSQVQAQAPAQQTSTPMPVGSGEK